MQPFRFAASLLALSVTIFASNAGLAAGPTGAPRAAAPAGAALSAAIARPVAAHTAFTPRFAPAHVGYWRHRAYGREGYGYGRKLPYVGYGGAYLPRRWWGGRWIFGGADDPPWAGQLTALQNQALPAPVPRRYLKQRQLPIASFPVNPPYAPPTFQIIGDAPTRHMQRPVKLTQGERVREVVNTEPRIIWLDRKGNVVADNRGSADPHVRHIK
jgi:hypothetical protein